MNSEESNSFATNELDWLAFCYVNDELDFEEQEAFERRLLEDQVTRDAVESAVRQQTLLAAALQPVANVCTDRVVLAASREFPGDPATFTSLNGSFNGSARVGSNVRRRWIGYFAVASALLFVSLMLWGQFGPQKLWNQFGSTQVARSDAAIEEPIFSDEGFLMDQEEYANWLVDVFSGFSAESELEDSQSIIESFDSVTLQEDWMLDLFSEIGDEWDDLNQIDDETEPKVTKAVRNWG